MELLLLHHSLRSTLVDVLMSVGYAKSIAYKSSSLWGVSACTVDREDMKLPSFLYHENHALSA